MQSTGSTHSSQTPMEVKKISKIGLMRHIGSDIFNASGILFPHLIRMKTTVDRIEIIARWSPVGSPDLECRKQTMLACGSLLHHIRKSFAAMGWKAEVRFFPKLDKEDVLAYVRAASRKPYENAALPNQPALDDRRKGSVHSDSECICDDVTLKVDQTTKSDGGVPSQVFHFRTPDDDPIAWIKTGKAYACLFDSLDAGCNTHISIPEPKYAIHTNGATWYTQLIVENGQAVR